MAERRCVCRCHQGGLAVFHVEPLLTDPVAGVTACRGCEPDHYPERRYPKVAPQADGEGEG